MKDQHSSWDIRLEHLRVGYGSRVVLDNINAVLPGGKITVILGESGCGKSDLAAARHRGFRGPCRGISFMGGKICSRSQNASSGGAAALWRAVSGWGPARFADASLRMWVAAA